MKPTCVLDGYNLIHRAPELRRRVRNDLHAGREALIQLCRDWRTLRRDISSFIIVLDGRSGIPPGANEPAPGIQLLFTASKEEADDRIVRLLPGLVRRGPVSVVTDDRPLRQRARALGAEPISVDDFTGRLSRRKAVAEPARLPAGKTNLTPQQEKAINNELKKKWGDPAASAESPECDGRDPSP